MDRAYQSGAAVSAPSAPASPSTGYPTAGNPGSGTPATTPGPYWYHMVMEELMAVISAAGITPDQTKLTQLASAIQSGKLFAAAAAGTADDITASFSPAITSLTNGMSLFVRASLVNATTTPTFTPNSGTIAAKQIVKGPGLALVAGDIAGGGHWIELQYDQTLDKWVLLNPAYGIKTAMGVYSGIVQYNVNTTLTASDIGKAIAVGGSSGTMTLPLLSATRPGDSMLLFCQGGTGVLQPQGADTLYGGSSSLASLTFKGSEFVEVTNFGSSWVITGGSWLSSALGVNQTWQNVVGSRAIGTTYTNTTGRPITVKVSYGLVSGNGLKITVGGLDVAWISGNAATVIYQTMEAVVPVGATYVVSYFVGSSSSAQGWVELR